MLALKLDVRGRYALRWPDRDADVIRLGETVLKYDDMAPEEQRLPSRVRGAIESLTQQASAAATTAVTSERDRASSSAAFDTLLKTAVPRGSLAIDRLKGQYAENLAQLERWGVVSNKAKNGGIRVRKPEDDGEWVAFFNAYVAREASIDTGLRVKDPPWEEMSGYAIKLSAMYQAREQSRSQREISVGTRTAAATQLLVQAQCAAVYLVVAVFGGSVSKELTSWGFEVIEAVPAATTTASSSLDASTDSTVQT